MARQEHRASPIAVLVVLSGSIFTGMIFVALGPVLPAIATHFGGGDGGAEFAQWTMTAPSIGLVLGGLIGGFLIDRLGAARILPPTFAIYAACGLVGYVVESAAALLVSRFAIGFCACMLSIATTSLIAQWFDETGRAKMLGYKNAVSAMVGVGGTLIAGAVAEAFGWRAAFLVYGAALLFVVPAILATRGAPRSIRIEQPDPNAPGAWQAIASFWYIYLCIVIFGVLLMATVTQVPFLLLEVDVTGPSRLSFVLVCASIGSTVGAGSFGHVFARLGLVRTFLAIMATWTAGMALLGTAPGAGQAALGCFLSGLAGGMFVVYMTNALVARSDAAIRARALGILYVAIFAGDFLNPIIVIPLAEALTRHGAFLALAGVSATAFIVMLAMAAAGLTKGKVARRPAV